jgi:hypothetical protein
MNFLKQHYEKILLGTVLAGLVVVAAVLLPVKIANEERELEQRRQQITARHAEPLPPLKVSRTEEALKRLQDPAKLNFAAPHYLFNPVPWQKSPDGRLVKVPQTGREIAVQVTKVAPLYLTITFDSVGATGSNYLIKVEKETEISPAKRKMSGFIELNVKPARLPLVLREVKGPLDNPGELVLELSDTGERCSIATNRPYRRVDGYTADFKSENKTWPNQREGARLLIGGEEYTVERINAIASNQFEVVLSAKSTGKKSTVKFEKKEDENQKAAVKPGPAS